MLYNRILAEKQRLQKELNLINKQLSTLPEGNIYCVKDGNRYKCFKSAKPKPQYLSKENRTLAEQLAIKKYLSCRYKDLLHEKTAIDFYLRHHHSDYLKSEELLTHPAYQDLLSPHFKPLSQELSDWINKPYEKNQKHPEHLIYKTSSGNLVRSKSEALIDMLLYTNQIPFRYECALHLGESTIYPDFTIRHPQTGEIFYWEHFGMMDNLYYRQKYISKLQLYLSYNIIPTIQLLTTFETSEHPLNIEIINQIIHHYFL